jgi:hypothetical protein
MTQMEKSLLNSYPNPRDKMIKGYQDLVFSIIDADLKSVKENMELELKRIVNFPLNWVVNSEPLDLKKIYFPSPTMGKAIDQRFCLYSPLLHQNKTIFFPNFPDGWSSLIYNYSKRYDCPTFCIKMSEQDVQYPQYWFQTNYGLKKRIVYAMKDSSKWVFHETGEMQPYEDTIHYAKKRVKDRMNESIINEYLKKNGWDIDDPRMWQSDQPAIYYQRLQWDIKGN